MTELRGKRVLITGGSRGMGQLMASMIAARGAHVVIWSRDRRRLALSVSQIRAAGGSVEAAVCDVSDRAAVYAAAAELRARGGPIQVLINNAGVVWGKPFLELTDEQIEQTLRVNTLAHFWTAKAFLPDMIAANEGHLVTMSSAAGLVAVAGLSDYSASKSAVFGFHEALRLELRKQKSKLKTTVVCPYYVDTGMFEGVKTRFSPILPILQPTAVARKIVCAIETNRHRVLMPPIVYTIPMFRLLPVPAMDAVAELLGLSNSMDGFVGHEGRANSRAARRRSRPRAPSPQGGSHATAQ